MALANLRTIEPEIDLRRRLQILAFAEAGLAEDRQRIQDNVKWLLDARVYKSGEFIGWSYDRQPSGGIADNSNTQYAVLGLWAAKQAGIDVPDAVFKEIRDFYIEPSRPQRRLELRGRPQVRRPSTASRMTMTTAGLCGLLDRRHGAQRPPRDRSMLDGTATSCGVYDESPPIAEGPAAGSASTSTRQLDGRTFYHLYGLERAGRLSGLRFLGNHDWYREGCEFLVEQQNKADGSLAARRRLGQLAGRQHQLRRSCSSPRAARRC